MMHTRLYLGQLYTQKPRVILKRNLQKSLQTLKNSLIGENGIRGGETSINQKRKDAKTVVLDNYRRGAF